MGINVKIEGLRFRASDGTVKEGDQAKMVRQRLTGTAGMQRIRSGDNPEALKGYLALRRPLADIKIEMAGIAEAEKLASVLKIETVKIGGGIELAEKVATNNLWERLMAEDSSLRPYYWSDEEIGISTGGNQPLAGGIRPVVGITYKQAVRAAEVLSELTGEKWFIPEEDQLLKGKDLVKTVNNKYGDTWEWTNTDYKEGSPYKAVRNLLSGGRIGLYPNNCSDDSRSVRFAKRT